MIILNAFKDLILMKNTLSRELPQSINVLGGLFHILEGNMFQLKMCVDSWPTFSTAICYRQKQINSSMGEIPDVCRIFSKNQDTLRSLLTDDSLLKWGNNLEFRVESTHHPILEEIACLRGLHLKQFGCFRTFIHYSPETFGSSQKTSKQPMTSLSESHADLVLKAMRYGTSKECINLVKAYIKYLPNYCVVVEKGQPVSWLLTDEFNEIRMAYTQPEYRRAGHLRELYSALIQQRISAGLPVFGCIHKENRATNNAALSFGMTPCIETYVQCIDL
ncbi:glycine N-acyltransferase-like protein 3 [Dunckerocampus dactyliophorus]|uniref:glycine N-acyltransferase-like protein 3 n=1 Tax=Dunckerocampus dactyliophorus TaxID=161453 RepID=UPI002406CF83|nr:glycine N-acyltransferase-like protein 3 [Dunckerocampus dactyliophorus]